MSKKISDGNCHGKKVLFARRLLQTTYNSIRIENSINPDFEKKVRNSAESSPEFPKGHRWTGFAIPFSLHSVGMAMP